MLTAVIVLAVLALVLGATAVVALVARGRALADTAGARAEVRRLAEVIDMIKDERDGAVNRANGSGSRVNELSTELASANARLEAAAHELDRVRLDAERRLKEHLQLEERFKDAFRALSADALKESRDEFIRQTKPVFEAAKKEQGELVRPITETLAATKQKLAEIEEKRTASFAHLAAQIETMTGANSSLRQETERLTRALSRPEVRGRYGEIQLRRVAELAGMRDYCDFEEQASGVDESGNAVRPDMVVKLPNSRVIAVDAKTNIDAYIQAVNARDEHEREANLDRFARHVADQAKKLADKRYWSGWTGSPEFVVMFVPGDHFIDAALSRKPELLEYAAQHRVILASPSTLIGLLRAVAVGWREHSLSEQAQALFELGRELHDRAATAFSHVDRLGQAIRQTTARYNDVVGSIDTRLVPTLKRFEEAGAKSAKELAELKPIETETRALAAAPDTASSAD
ncbi:MAG: DNA recombination protein RmuC [Phycisphaerales bacterium]